MSAAVRAVPASARSMNWAPLAGAAVSLGVIALAVRPWQGHPLSLSVARLAIAVAAVAVVFALDDRAAATVAALPTTLAQRRAARLVVAVAAAGAVAAAPCLAIAAFGGMGSLPATRLLLESTGMVLASLAFGMALGGDRGAGVFAGALLAAFVVQQALPELALFPLAAGLPGWDEAGVAWTVIAAASGAAVVLLCRDPATGGVLERGRPDRRRRGP